MKWIFWSVVFVNNNLADVMGLHSKWKIDV
jgi:hypothetical protein